MEDSKKTILVNFLLYLPLITTVLLIAILIFLWSIELLNPGSGGHPPYVIIPLGISLFAGVFAIPGLLTYLLVAWIVLLRPHNKTSLCWKISLYINVLLEAIFIACYIYFRH